MTYKLFIDDERYPPRDGGKWYVARSMDEVKFMVSQHGWPEFMSFDHDLGDDTESGMDIAKWIVEQDLNGFELPHEFEFYVHSQNPIGAENIRSLLSGYLRHKEG